MSHDRCSPDAEKLLVMLMRCGWRLPGGGLNTKATNLINALGDAWRDRVHTKAAPDRSAADDD